MVRALNSRACGSRECERSGQDPKLRQVELGVTPTRRKVTVIIVDSETDAVPDCQGQMSMPREGGYCDREVETCLKFSRNLFACASEKRIRMSTFVSVGICGRE
jgi:hypothetical protein